MFVKFCIVDCNLGIQFSNSVIYILNLYILVDTCISFWQLCDVPLLSKRLDLLFTIREFPANFEGFQPVCHFNHYQIMHKLYLHIQIQQSLDLAWKATRELKEYNGFVEVLQCVLAMGNFLNAGSRQGGAYGFKLSTLPKVCLLSIMLECTFICTYIL